MLHYFPSTAVLESILIGSFQYTVAVIFYIINYIIMQCIAVYEVCYHAVCSFQLKLSRTNQ